MKTPEPDEKKSGRGVYSPLPEYPGLPSKTRKTTVVVVPKKRAKKSDVQSTEPAAAEPEPKQNKD
jgi:hypothetical protein